MRNGFYWKLAANNMQNNRRTYVPYLLTSIITVMMFFLVDSLANNSRLEETTGGSSVTYMLGFGVWITGIFAVIFLFYTNSFLMKRRKKELGLYNILGMEKRHISRMILCETIYLLVISLVVGLSLGLLLDRLMFLIVLNMLRADIPLQFELSVKPVIDTLILFTALFAAICLNSLRQIHLAKPIELLKGGQVGEREPKAKWALAILGLICLGFGYTIALTTKNPLAAFTLFFVAVLLVIVGTYLLFLAGSISLLKLMRKNKRYYYHPRHFTSVSGMIYRMKQNAVGLANICILSTMVLVTVSSTLSLYIGMEDILSVRYPRDIRITYSEQDQTNSRHMHAWVDSALGENQPPKNEIEYTFLEFAASQDGDYFSTDRSIDNLSHMNGVCNLFFMPLSDYNRMTDQPAALQGNEILIGANRGSYDLPLLRVFDETFTVKGKLDGAIANGELASDMAGTYFVVVPEMADVQRLNVKQQLAYPDMSSSIKTYYAFDLDGSREEVLQAYHRLEKSSDVFRVECVQQQEASFLSTFGSLFFIGLFLGALFLMATILIIYYKQISEGYDDRERFTIMQKVGMSRQEIRRTIHSQILVVFFMPLIVAGVHMAFAFPFVGKLLELFNMRNTLLFAGCSLGSFLLFGLLYAGVYLLTARSYYKIVSETDDR